MHLPNDGASPDIAAVVLAVKHRPTRDHNGWHVAACRAHQQCGRCFIAAGEQHDRINRVPPDRLFDIHAGQITGQHGGRSEVRLAIGKDRKLHGIAAGFKHALFHMLGDLAEMCVAGGQLRPGVANADDRFSLKFVIRNALILHPAAVHEAVLIGGAEPLSGAQGAFFDH